MVNETIASERIGALQWIGAPPPVRARAVIVAPHPDDEVLGSAGIMRWLTDAAIPIEIVAVTDGEASHAASRRVGREWLRVTCATERVEALERLELGALRVHRLGFADAAVAADEAMLADRLVTFCDATTTIVVPWSADGHPDHEAVGRAGRIAAARAGAGMWETAIWANARRDFVAAHVLRLGDFATTKRHAVAAFRVADQLPRRRTRRRPRPVRGRSCAPSSARTNPSCTRS